MADFKPLLPYTVPAEILQPEYTTIKGVKKKTYPDSGERINVSFKTYGGTESESNGIYTVLDTATVETWYRPDIKSECRIKVLLTGAIYEIIAEPENINMRNQFCKFKVQRVKGGAGYVKKYP